MKFLKQISIICLSLILLSSCAEKTVPLKVLQINTWFECQKVPNGLDAMANTIERTDPDVIFFCELHTQEFFDNLKKELKARGKEYNGDFKDMGVAILSKYKVKDLHLQYRQDEGKSKGFMKGTIEVGGQTIDLYSGHLDYLHYECYMPRGYNGYTWKKMEAPANNADTVLAYNRMSLRDEGVASFLKDAKVGIEKGHLIIMGGDFNEPSHLDWQADTKDMRDHNGLVINWDCSVMLQEHGFKDSYRELYPNPVTHPGFTYACGNKYVEKKELVWTEGVDDRDRIDFVYYMPNENIELKGALIVGPVEDFLKGELVDGKTEDPIFTPEGVWPTDHKANLVTFNIKVKE